MLRSLQACWLLLLVASFMSVATAAPTFPALSGRVIDQAGLLSTSEIDQLTSRLAAHEQATSNQLVVVTLKDLQGYAIDDFGYQLGRHWGIGQGKLNNGVLLIVAPAERKVRIEIGYGLEGDLPDALASQIIQQEILPRFKKQDYSGGISQGVDAIIAAIKGSYKAKPGQVRDGDSEGTIKNLFMLVIFGIFMGESIASRIRPRIVGAGLVGGATGLIAGLIATSLGVGFVVALLVAAFHLFLGGGNGGNGGHGGFYGGFGGGTGGGFGGGGFGGGGFGGGGGSFGGGGASGGW